MTPADIGESISWGAAYRLVEMLAVDPSAHLGAALSGWEYPVESSTLVLMDLFDQKNHIEWIQGGKKGKKPKPYPRPWPDKTRTTTKPDADLTQAEIVAALRMAGHTAALPTAP